MSIKSKVNIDLGGININNVGTFKKLNEVILPTRYPKDFYDLDATGVILRLAYFNEVPVGAIKAKPVYLDPKDKLPTSIYIDSIAVLEKYRSFGIGSKLLEFVEEETKKRYIHEVTINVQKSSADLIQWYNKKGYEITGEIQGYYREHKLEDIDAVTMAKKI